MADRNWKRKTFRAKVGHHTYRCGARRTTLDVDGVGGVEVHWQGIIARMLPAEYGEEATIKVTITRVDT